MVVVVVVVVMVVVVVVVTVRTAALVVVVMMMTEAVCSSGCGCVGGDDGDPGCGVVMHEGNISTYTTINLSVDIYGP